MRGLPRSRWAPCTRSLCARTPLCIRAISTSRDPQLSILRPVGNEKKPNWEDRQMGLLRFFTAQGLREANGMPFGPGPPLLVTTSAVMHGATVWALVGATPPGHLELSMLAGSFALRMFGITAGYHRYFAHGSYKTSRTFQFVLALLGASAWQKGPLWWASHHVEHHLHSDQRDDPHSPVSGSLIWAHMGWFWACMEFDGHPPAYRAGRSRVAQFKRFPELVSLDRFHHGPGIALAGLAYAVHGTPGLLWGFVVPTVGAWHATFAVNSLCHKWGSRRFQTTDHSRNNLLVALTSFGEGNHNNHHAFPWSAKHGLTWREPDLTYVLLRILESIGIVWDLKVPTDSQIQRAQQSKRLRVSKQAGVASS